MKKHTILLVIYLIASHFTYSQKTPADTVKTEKDTSFLVSKTDIETYNHVFADLESCTELRDSLIAEISICESVNQKNDLIIEKYKQSEINLKAQVNEKTIKGQILQANNNYQSNVIKWLKFQRNGLSIALGASLIAGAYFYFN